jgi:alkylhydroperoxidase family enzyme
MVQSVIVALIVAAAALYSVWLFLPAAWRRALAARVARQAGSAGLGSGQVQALQARLERAPGCGDCASCRGCAPVDGQREAPRH